MYKFSKKILSTVIAITLVGSNAMPALVYAADEISKEKNSINAVESTDISNATAQNDTSNTTVQENTSNETIKESGNEINNEEPIQWDQNAQVVIKQELKRYLKYENKTLVSFLVSNGVKDNAIPLLEKTIQIYVPKIQDKEPSKIIVSGKEYDYQNQILVINDKINEKDSKKINWNSNDEFLVTFIYDAQMEGTTLNSLGIISATTIDERKIEARTEEFTYNVSEQIGNLLEANISGDMQVNKGYLYTNLNRTENKLETRFTTNYQINVGFVDLIDKIQIKESNLSDKILTKKITVNKEELTSILGKEGTIQVLDSQNQVIDTLKEDKLEIEVESYGLKFITSKPITEGYINIKLEKVLNINTKYTLESIQNENEIENSIDVIGYLQENEVSNNHFENKISLVEPTSNASISVDKNALSTVITNENVVITAILEKNDITDALYKDPELLITLPSQVTGVNLKDARLIYENELVPVNFKTIENKIYLRLEGTQTEYSLIPNVEGSVIKIVADLTLDNLAVNSDEKIELQYTNKLRNEAKSVETPIKIVAPTGFVTSNYGKVDQTVSSINNDEALLIKANDIEKQIMLGGIAVSNLKESATGLMILGRFPVQETKLIDEESKDLNSTYSININTPINVEGIDADIYYSDNGGATYDLANEQNGWSLEKKDTSKSYLIVAKSEVLPAQRITFTYNGTIPNNLDYENSAKTMFGVYYNNEAKEGMGKNIISSKLLSIETENIPVIQTKITASDYNVGDEIKNGDKINNGKFIKYVVSATNTGRKTAENVTLTVEKPDNSQFYIEEEIENEDVYDNYFIYEPTLTNEIEKIEPGETVEFVYVVRIYGQNENEITFRANVKAENMLEDSTASFENVVVERTFEMTVYTSESEENVKIGDEINYTLSINYYGIKNFNNVKIKINIPKYIDLLNYEGGNYDKENRILSYEIASLEKYTTYNFKAKVKESDEASQEISLVAKATYDGADKEIKSNTYTCTIQDLKGFSVTFNSNIIDKMLDTDTVEYYINVKNDSKKSAKINIFNKLPDELKLISYTIKNGDNTFSKDDAIISTNIEENLLPGDNLKLTIVAKPYILDSVGQTKQIENKVEVKVNDIDFPVEKVKQKIEGTSNFNTVVTGENQEEIENIYSISGKAWYDENSNSAQDENEARASNILVKLFDVNKKDFLKDKDGNDIMVSTNDNGEYKFENLYNGRYIVIADYDSKAYKVANYQAGNLSQNEDNDFIESNKIEDSEVIENSDTAATNVITLSGENVYNIDLGLMDSENFNITINNEISKITVIDGEKTETYDFDGNTANLLVDDKTIENSTLIIEYLIKINNVGNIDGYVTQIASKLQENLEFVSELNQDWYVNANKEIINSSLSNKLIKSGETETLKLVLIRNKNKSGEVITNVSEIRGTYNQYGIEEITTTELTENKAKSAQIYLSVNSTNGIAETIGISLVILVIISLISFGDYKLLQNKLKQ